MCEGASLISTKDKVYWIPQFNSHTKICKAAGIKDDKIPPDFVKQEITPPLTGGRPDYSAPLEKWIYKVDQDTTPSWYVPKADEKRARKALVDWYASHITGKCTDAKYVVFSGGYGSTLTGGDGSTLTGGDCSTLTGGDCSTLKGGDGSTLTGGDCSTLTGGDDSTLTGGDGSTLTGGYGSTLTGGDGSTLTGGDCSTLTGGELSVFVVRWHDGKKWCVAKKVIGEKEADKAYKFVNGKFKEVKKEKQ